MTMVVVTHEMGFAREAATRVVFMDQGRIVETAGPDAFFTKPATDRARQFLARYGSGPGPQVMESRAVPIKTHGIGASVVRKEDDRFLRGRGQFVGDFHLAGMREVAFVRSPVAHALCETGRRPGAVSPCRFYRRTFDRRQADRLGAAVEGI